MSIASSITPEQLKRLNATVKFGSLTPTPSGMLGRETRVYTLDDFRVAELSRRGLLEGSSVVELGCYEGAHTVCLGLAGANPITAVEGRIESLAAAMVRCGVYGVKADFVLADVESSFVSSFTWPVADVYFNCGLLYHMADPLPVLQRSCRSASKALLLDTHYAKNAKDAYRGLLVKRQKEIEHPKSGMREYSLWMMLEDIVAVIRRSFKNVEVSDRIEQNGPRATIIATGKI